MSNTKGKKERKNEKEWTDMSFFCPNPLSVGELYGIRKQRDCLRTVIWHGSAGTSVFGMGVQCRVTVSKHPLNHTIFYVQFNILNFCDYKFWHRMKQSAI